MKYLQKLYFSWKLDLQEVYCYTSQIADWLVRVQFWLMICTICQKFDFKFQNTLVIAFTHYKQINIPSMHRMYLLNQGRFCKPFSELSFTITDPPTLCNKVFRTRLKMEFLRCYSLPAKCLPLKKAVVALYCITYWPNF